jgi:hypothetical protein
VVCRGCAPLNKAGVLGHAFGLFVEVAEHPLAGRGGRERSRSGFCGMLGVLGRRRQLCGATALSFLWSAMVAVREKGRAFSAADLEAPALLALLRFALHRLGCFFTKLVFSAYLLLPMAGAGSSTAGSSSPSEQVKLCPGCSSSSSAGVGSLLLRAPLWWQMLST